MTKPGVSNKAPASTRHKLMTQQRGTDDGGEHDGAQGRPQSDTPAHFHEDGDLQNGHADHDKKKNDAHGCPMYNAVLSTV